MAENKQRFAGVVGPSYTVRSERFDCQETINYYIELDELGGGKGGEPAVLMPTPGLDLLQTIGSGPIRCLYTQSNDQITYVVSGSEVYHITGALASPVRITGNLTTNTGPVQATDNGYTVIFVDGVNGYTTDIGTGILDQISDVHFHSTDTITYQDGYFIGVDKGTQGFFTSSQVLPGTTWGPVTWPDLNESFAEGNPDTLVAAISNNRQLYLLGTKSTETFYNAGLASTNPFVRQDGRQSQIGCAAPASIAVLQEQFFWLGSNAQGGGVVYTLANGMPTAVSTRAVEFSIQGAGTLGSATAFAYQMEGHLFYCLNIAGLDYTWCYDMTSQQWHKRQSNINGNAQKCVVRTHAVLNNQHIVGDYSSGNIYEYNLNTWTENGNPLYRIRQFPHNSKNLQRTFYNLLECDFQMGVGLPNENGAPVYPNPPIPPSYYSNPHSFSNTVPPQLLSFTTSPTEPIANEPVQFTNTSSPALGGVGWDFGDGNTSGDPNPIHTYTQTGTFYPNMLASVVFNTTPPLYSLQWTNGNISEILTNGTYTELIYTYGHFTINGIPVTSGVTPSGHTITYTITTTALSGPAIVTSYQTISGYPNSGSPMIEQSIISPGVPTSGPFGNNGVFATDGGDRGFFYDTMVSITANVDGAQVGNTLNVRMTPIGSTGGSGSATAQLTYTTSSSPTGYIPSTNVLIASPLVVSQPTPSPGSDPRIVLYSSKDGGQTWSNPKYATLGKIGQYFWRARWGPLGSSRDMVFRVVCTEPVRVVMLSGYLDTTDGTS